MGLFREPPKQECYSEFMPGYLRLLKEVNEFLDSRKVYAIAGGSGSGKSKIARLISNDPKIWHWELDNSFMGPKKVKYTNKKDYDHPDCYNLESVHEGLRKFNEGSDEIRILTYEKETQKHGVRIVNLKGVEAIVLEGIHALQDTVIAQIDYGVYIYAPEWLRYKRRLERDLAMGEPKKSIDSKWKIAESVHVNHVESTKMWAHLIIKNESLLEALL
jgi:uridine kinase